MRSTIVLFALALLPFWTTGCTYNPATGRHQLLMLSSDQEVALGEEAMPKLVTEYGGAVGSTQLSGYVTAIGRQLSEVTEDAYRDLPWEFTVLDSEVINAFALPGGKVFISRGLMERLGNEAQLAGVLGHEVGHVTSQHIDERMSQSAIAQGLVIGAAVAAGTQESEWAQVVPLLVGAGGQGYLLKFGRDQELEADRQGVKYMTRIGYDPRGMRQVLAILKDAAGERTQPEILSTHPDPDRRIRQLDELLAGEYRDTQDSRSHKLFRGRYEREALSVLGVARGPDASGGPALAALPASVAWCSICASETAAGTR